MQVQRCAMGKKSVQSEILKVLKLSNAELTSDTFTTIIMY